MLRRATALRASGAASAAAPAPLLERCASFGPRTAVIDQGDAWTYERILEQSSYISSEASAVLDLGAPSAPHGTGALVLTQPGTGYVTSTCAAWGVGIPTVPLCASHTVPEMVYYAQDSGSRLLLHDTHSAGRAEALRDALQDRQTLRLINVDSPSLRETARPAGGITHVDIAADPAMVLYTSGTTGNPKGVVHTFGSLQNQVDGLVQSWGWTSQDSIINCLPLHHVHGVVNALLCPLSVGAECEFSSADPPQLLRLMGEGRHTVFTAVPTVYARLLKEHAELPASAAAHWRATVGKAFRVMMCGSAALPPSVLHRWHSASGHTLLERYGMTEAGMILSQPLHGDRLQGTVGTPLPTVEAKLLPIAAGEAEGSGAVDEPLEEGAEVGDLAIRSGSLFAGYLNRPEATRETFTADGWFVTGDYAKRDANGVYSILGRSSVDIIKSAGFKLSALEIEAVLLQHEGVAECAVVGLPDETFGEVVAALVVLCQPGGGSAVSESELAAHASENLARYKVPRVYRFTDSIPRNAMGKVNKKELKRFFS